MKSKIIFDTLIDSFDGWSKLNQEDCDPILDILFLYGSRFNALKEIGSRLLVACARRKLGSPTLPER
jgi:hypothetical protein